MRPEEKYIAKILFKNKVFELKGQAFEDFFVLIMRKAYTDFQPVKASGNIGDMKNDGFIFSTGTFYQVFAPEDISKLKTTKDAINKLEDDFKGLYKHWSGIYKIQKYYFVINDKFQGLPPQIIQKAEELNQKEAYSNIDIQTFTTKDIENIFGQLPDEDIYEVVGFIPDSSTDIIEYSALNEVVDYLLKVELPEGSNNNLIVPDFNDKIIFNGLSDQVRAKLITGSYQEGPLQGYFNETPGIKEILQQKFHGLYLLSCEKIPEREENVADRRYYFILDKASPKRTVPILACVEVLMSYYFSSCDIFEEPI